MNASVTESEAMLVLGYCLNPVGCIIKICLFRNMSFAVTWMNLDVIILSEVRQICDIICMWNQKMIQINLFTKQK